MMSWVETKLKGTSAWMARRFLCQRSGKSNGGRPSISVERSKIPPKEVVAEIEALGYNVETHGQKGFNGVAILSRRPIEDVVRGLPGDDIVAALVRDLPSVLTPGGTAQLLGNWEIPAGAGWDERPHSWAGADADAWFIQREQVGEHPFDPSVMNGRVRARTALVVEPLFIGGPQVLA